MESKLVRIIYEEIAFDFLTEHMHMSRNSARTKAESMTNREIENLFWNGRKVRI